jgi:hypothetical protein
MAEVLQWFDKDHAAIFVEGGPFILFVIAWLAMRSQNRDKSETRRPGSIPAGRETDR